MRRTKQHPFGPVLAVAVLFLALCASPRVSGATPLFANGADVGWMTQLEGMGYTWFDETDTQLSALQILKNHGVNTIRIRTFVNPTITPGILGVGDTNQSGSIALAQLANSMGFQLMIDFQYSDTWADPGDQAIPSAWSGESYAQLESSVYSYTYNFMQALASDGIYPQWVQVGNEIDNGMLFPTGSTSNFSQLTGLINSGYNAVKAVSSSTQVVIHLSTISDLSHFETFFDSLLGDGGKFDAIGGSYYDGPDNISTVASNVNALAARYGKPVIICEIGHAESDWTGSNADVKGAIQALKAVPNGMGLGVIYWEPEAPDDADTNNYGMGATQILTGDELQFTSAIDPFLFNIASSNQIIDPGFTTGLNGWQISPTTGGYSSTYTQASGSGYELSFWSNSFYNTTVWQTDTELPSGTYTLTAWVENGGGEKSATMFAYPAGGREISVKLPVASTWTEVQIPGIVVNDGNVYLGFSVNAHAGNWVNVNWVQLTEN
ncbi:MAG: glycosyl hydrolase 53 family protein [Candidatus Sulfotelmatobacter sp.]